MPMRSVFVRDLYAHLHFFNYLTRFASIVLIETCRPDLQSKEKLVKPLAVLQFIGTDSPGGAAGSTCGKRLVADKAA